MMTRFLPLSLFMKSLGAVSHALFACSLLLAAPVRAQLDLGSQDIPKDSIDAYMAPFYRLVAAGLGADRNLPAPRGDRFGWHAGLQGGGVAIPSGRAFGDVAISTLPVFRLEGGVSWALVGAMARGMAWSDPRMGDLSTFGGALALGREFRPASWVLAGRPLSLAPSLVASWDRLVFESRYTYRYRGSLLGFFDQDIPGDYVLSENLTGFGAQGRLGWGRWGLSLEALYERASGRFRYLYLDPRSEENTTVSSDVEEGGLRAAAGLSWRGFRVQGGWRDFPYLSAGWSFNR